MKNSFKIIILIILLFGQQLAFSQERPFITTWTTSEDLETISIPLNEVLSYDFQYVWRDATGNVVSEGTHTSADGAFETELPTIGTYSLEIVGDFPHFQGYPKNKLIDVNQWGDIVWGSMFQTFNEWPGVAFSAEDNPDLSQVTGMGQMFFRASNFNDDISDWDVSNVITMSVLFREATAFNQPLDSWNVSNVTNMAIMFENADSFNQDLNNWNTSRVTNMDRMFNGAGNFNGNISSWDVSSVTNMNQMFRLAGSFNSDISDWQVGNVTNMADMLNSASVFNQDISSWDVSQVTNMNEMLRRTAFNQDISTWNVSRISDMINMFQDANLSSENYNQILIGWASLPILRRNVGLGAPGVEVCEGEAARFRLQDQFGWNINDGGVCDQAENILKFNIVSDQIDEEVIDYVNHTVTLAVLLDADLTNLTPRITLSEGASSVPADELVQDFTNPVTYTVTAEDGETTQSWTVTVGITDQRPFITTWSAVAGESIVIPLNGNFDYNFNYTWKDADGNEITGLSGRHTSSDGAFTTSFAETAAVTLEITGDFPHFQGYPKDQLNDVAQWGEIRWRSFEQSFEEWDGPGFSATDVPNLSSVTRMVRTFRFTDNFNSDISSWDVSNVTNMNSMFQGAVRFNADISGWDVSSVTNMGVMFAEARVFDQPIGSWNVENVTSMSRMFRSADSFNQNLSDWDVSKVINMNEMFQNTNVFNGDVGTWDVGSVENMLGMFNNAAGFNQDLNNWNVGSVIDMSAMFRSAVLFNGDISTWNVARVENMQNMFRDADAFNQDLNEWNVSNVTNMGDMFFTADVFNGDISQWNVENVTNMQGMFADALLFNSDLSEWNVGNVQNMRAMFRDARAFNANISSWNVENVTAMNDMFRETRSFNQDIGSWNVSNVSNMGNMFQGAGPNGPTVFDQDLSEWNVVRVTNMAGMFTNSNLSSQNYDRILIGWAARDSLQSDVTFGVGKTFCTGAAARAILTDPDGLNWNVNDAGELCSSETDIVAFELAEEFVEAVIDPDLQTVQAVVIFGTDITALSPFITLSPGATISPESEEVLDFTSPVDYLVTAEDSISDNFWTVTVSSQPANDFCTGAITVNVGDVVTGNTTFASNDANIAANCGSNVIDDGSRGIWYQFLGTGELITLRTSNTDFNTSLGVYAGSCQTGLTCIAGNDDISAFNNDSEASFISVPDQEYLILVDGNRTGAGTFDLSITAEVAPVPPANDNCEDAEVLTVFEEGAGTPTNGDNTNATAFIGQLPDDIRLFNPESSILDVWYSFNSGLNTSVQIAGNFVDTDGPGPLEVASSLFILAYDVCGGEPRPIVGDDGDFIASMEVIPGTDYWLQVFTNSLEKGTFTIQLNDGPNTAPELSFREAIADVIDISRFAVTGAEIDSVSADDAENHTQVLSIASGNEEGIFAIDSESGSITIADGSILNASASTSFTLTIQSSDRGPGEVSSSIDLTVNVIDNAPPVIVNETIFIDENTANGTLIAIFQVSDPDGNNISAVTGSTDPNGILIVDEGGEIIVDDESMLDFETTPSITTTFTVRDDGPLGLETTGTIIVNLNDVNEAPEVPEATFSISTFSENGFAIGTIPFTDQDGGQTHTYAILDDGDNDGAVFSIDPTTGELTVLDQALLAANGAITYTFEVEVTDNGDSPLSGAGVVTITTFANNSPVITSESFEINENSNNNTQVGFVRATDADGDDVTFSLEDGSSVFRVDGNGRIRVADRAALDFETNPSFELLVGATDNGEGTLKTTKVITIALNDVNESPEITPATFDISSFISNGAIIGQIIADDPDGDVIEFTIASGNEEGIFNITETGILSVVDASLLDPFFNPQYNLTVEASDELFTASSEVTINVFINNPPVLSPLAFEIDENNEAGALIGTLEVTDVNDILSLEITSGNEEGFLELDETTGELSALSPLNFEEIQSFELEVVATDDGVGNLSTTETIIISINDVNEFDPVIAPLAGAQLEENSAVGAIIAIVDATDQDILQTLTYEITTGNDEGIFAIDQNGEITTLEVIDFEQNASFNLTVLVSDDGTPVRTATETLTITVIDVNEAPVLKAIEDRLVIIETTVSFTAIASDPDNGDVLTFSLDAASAAAGMNIDPTTGSFTWIPTVDQVGDFTVKVSVGDGELTDTESLTISVRESLSTETDIITFVLAEQTGSAVIDAVNHSIAIEVAPNTDVTSLTPTLTLSEGATSNPESGEVVNFINAVVYTVTAEDEETSQDWQVTVTVEDDALGVDDAIGLLMYPNPVQDILFVKTEEEVSVSLTDLNGREVISRQQGHAFELDLSQLGASTYLLIIWYEDKMVSKRVIKSKD